MEAVRVECHAGWRAEEEPRAVHLDGARRRVAVVVARWREPAAEFFRVRLDDGRLCSLRHDPGGWFLVEVAPGGASAAETEASG